MSRSGRGRRAWPPRPPRSGVLLDRLPFGARHHQHRELAALARLERLQHLLERGLLLRAQRAGLVGDARERRHRDLGDRCQCDAQKKGEEEPHFLVPKSTLGGVAIAFSSSTVKFGFVLWPNAIAVRLVGNERTVTL